MDYNNQQNNYSQNSYTGNQPAMIPEEYTPISMWGYLGYQILFTLPCIGFIFLCVFSFGGTKNVNLRNFARSYFCILIITVVLTVILLIIGAIGGAGMAASGYSY